MKQLDQRFWEKVCVGSPSDCWEWQGARLNGYGRFSLKGRSALAHRIAYELAHDCILGDELCCHSCDNKACCNPGHLWLGTPADNMLDKVRKGRGRSPTGSACWRAKLREEDINPIRADHRTIRAIARDYGVTPQTISFVRSGRTWRHVPISDPATHSRPLHTLAAAMGASRRQYAPASARPLPTSRQPELE